MTESAIARGGPASSQPRAGTATAATSAASEE